MFEDAERELGNHGVLLFFWIGSEAAEVAMRGSSHARLA